MTASSGRLRSKTGRVCDGQSRIVVFGGFFVSGNGPLIEIAKGVFTVAAYLERDAAQVVLNGDGEAG